MGLKELKLDLIDEVSSILDPTFDIEVANTRSVPHSDDPAITFPNLDDRSQKTKLIETCVLYVDMGRSTELSFRHRPTTVAKLYSSFVRAMTRCATNYGGEVRGIIGDRVMVMFPSDGCFVSALDTAILMNSVCKYVLNEHFEHNEVTFGIGIDYGRMLATKTGIRRHGSAQASYRNLVWLGRPANIASKLTDMANKPEVSHIVDIVHVGYATSVFANWTWTDEYPWDFVKQLRYENRALSHNNPYFQSFFLGTQTWIERHLTPPILMTDFVYDGIRKAAPNRKAIKDNLIKKLKVTAPETGAPVYGGDVIFMDFKT